MLQPEQLSDMRDSCLKSLPMPVEGPFFDQPAVLADAISILSIVPIASGISHVPITVLSGPEISHEKFAAKPVARAELHVACRKGFVKHFEE